jgi:hypothetical protein
MRNAQQGSVNYDPAEKNQEIDSQAAAYLANQNKQQQQSQKPQVSGTNLAR